MEPIRVCLFGQFQVQCRGKNMTDAMPPRLQELLVYLLLFRDHAHPREVLAGLLWPDSTTHQSRRNLRQALWRLQSPPALGGVVRECDLILADRDWVGISPDAKLWLDVQVFEDTLSRTGGVSGRALDVLQADALRSAVSLYQGDLLLGWYQDWCLHERERLQNAYLRILEKLIDYCETSGEYRSGLVYADRALSCEGARERIHRRSMRLHYLVGERAAALRQYDSCVDALRQELGVRPAARTERLYQQIRAGQFPGTPQLPVTRIRATRSAPPGLPKMVERLQELQDNLNELQDQVQDALAATQRVVSDLP